MDGRFVHKTLTFGSDSGRVHVSSRHESKMAPCSKDRVLSMRARSSRPGRDSVRTVVIGRQCHVEEHAHLDHSIVWANSRVSQEAVVRRSILGRHVHVGRSATVLDGAVLGDKSVVTDYSRI